MPCSGIRNPAPAGHALPCWTLSPAWAIARTLSPAQPLLSPQESTHTNSNNIHKDKHRNCANCIHHTVTWQFQDSHLWTLIPPTHTPHPKQYTKSGAYLSLDEGSLLGSLLGALGLPLGVFWAPVVPFGLPPRQHAQVATLAIAGHSALLGHTLNFCVPSPPNKTHTQIKIIYT